MPEPATVKDEDLRRAYRSAYAGGTAVACLTAEELVRLATRSAGNEERERFADHLATCDRCSAEYRVLRSLEPWAERAAATLEPDRTASWSVFFTLPRLGYAAAGVFLIVNLALGFWIASLREENRDLRVRVSKGEPGTSPAPSQTPPAEAVSKPEPSTKQRPEEPAIIEEQRLAMAPQMNVPIVDLEPADALLRGSDAVRSIALPSSAALVVLVLNTTPGTVYGAYDVEIVSAGRVTWRGSGLERSREDTFTLTVPRRLLPAGVSHLRLYGTTASGRTLIEDYAVRINDR